MSSGPGSTSPLLKNAHESFEAGASRTTLAGKYDALGNGPSLRSTFSICSSDGLTKASLKSKFETHSQDGTLEALCSAVEQCCGERPAPTQMLVEAGLTSGGAMELKEVLESTLNAQQSEDQGSLELDPVLFFSGTCVEVARKIEEACNERDKETDEVELPCPPSCGYYIASTIGALLLLVSGFLPLWPLWSIVSWVWATDAPFWRGLVLSCWLFPLWMLFFSIVVVVSKWVVIGRYHEGPIPLWSFMFLRWWYIDRLIELWEMAVGYWILDTIVLGLFYKLCGARISLWAKFEDPIREMDLIEVSEGATVTGHLLTRLFTPDSVHLRRIVVGKCAKVKSQSYVLPGTQLDPCVVIESLSVTKPLEHLRGGTWAGNFSTKVSEEPAPQKSHLCFFGSSLIIMAFTVQLLCFVTAGFHYAWISNYTNSLLIVVKVFACLWVMGIAMTVLVLIGAWSTALLGCESEISKFTIKFWNRIAYTLMIKFLLESVRPLQSALLRIMGVNIGCGSLVTTHFTIKPWQASRISIGTDTMVAVSTLDAAKGTCVSIGSGCLVGNGAIVRGASVGDEAQVGSVTLVDGDVDDQTTVVGCPMVQLGKAPINSKELEFDGQLLFILDLAEFCGRCMLILILFVTVLPAANTVVIVRKCVTNELGFSDGFGVVCGSLSAALVFPISALLALKLVYVMLHPNKESTYGSDTFALVAWGCYNRFHIWMVYLIHPFIMGSWMISAWHRVMGANIGSGVLFLSTAVADQSLLDVGEGAIIDRDVFLNCHRFEKGKFVVARTQVGVGSVVGAGARVLGGMKVLDGACVDVLSCCHLNTHVRKSTTCRGSPAMRVRSSSAKQLAARWEPPLYNYSSWLDQHPYQAAALRSTFIAFDYFFWILSGGGLRKAMPSTDAARSVPVGEDPSCRRQRPEEWNAPALARTPPSQSKTLKEFLHSAVTRFAEKPCMYQRVPEKTSPIMVYGQTTKCTYQELGERVARFTLWFQSLGLTPQAGTAGHEPRGGEIFMVWLDTCPDWLAVCLACWCCSIAVSTVYGTLGLSALIHAAQLCEAHAMLCHTTRVKDIKHAQRQLPNLRVVLHSCWLMEMAEARRMTSGWELDSSLRILSVTDLDVKPHDSKPFTQQQSLPEMVFTVMFTSGSTGMPKGVVITQANILASVASGTQIFSKVLERGQPLDYLAFMPLAHIFELVIELTIFELGGSLCYANVQHLTAGSCQPHGGFAEFRPTVMAGVPKLWETLISRANARLETKSAMMQHLFQVALKEKIDSFHTSRRTPLLDFLVFNNLRELLGGRLLFTICGGAALRKEHHMFVMAVFGVSLVQGYGLTETCASGTVQEPFQFGRCDNVGPPAPSSEIKLRSCINGDSQPEVLDRAGKPYFSTDTRSHTGQIVLGRGEICIRGPSVARGYYNSTILTKKSFKSDGWFHTGDVGQWRADGALEVIDRLKNLVKLKGGEYIAIEYLETVYRSSKFVDITGGGMIVVGDSTFDRPVGLVIVNQDVLLHWAKDAGFDNQPLNTLANSHEARRVVLDSLNANSNGLTALERLGDVRLLLEPWTAENGCTTATGKPARHQIWEICADEIQDMRKKQEAATISSTKTYQEQ